MYFVKNGSNCFVLPKYSNTQYLLIEKGVEFGTEDIVGSILKNEQINEDDWLSQKEKIKRQFTVMSVSNSELLTLSINDINRMKSEFQEAYLKLIENSYSRLEIALMIKLECIKHCEQKDTKRIDS
jgi:hypothetical protein